MLFLSVLFALILTFQNAETGLLCFVYKHNLTFDITKTHAHTFLFIASAPVLCVCVCVCACVCVCVCVCVHVLCQSPSLQLCPFMCWVMRWPCAQSGQLALSNCSLPSIHTNSSGLSELYSLIRRPGNWAASIAIPLPPPPSFIWKKNTKKQQPAPGAPLTRQGREISISGCCRNAGMRQRDKRELHCNDPFYGLEEERFLLSKTF